MVRWRTQIIPLRLKHKSLHPSPSIRCNCGPTTAWLRSNTNVLFQNPSVAGKDTVLYYQDLTHPGDTIKGRSCMIKAKETQWYKLGPNHVLIRHTNPSVQWKAQLVPVRLKQEIVFQNPRDAIKGPRCINQTKAKWLFQHAGGNTILGPHGTSQITTRIIASKPSWCI